ncbi:MAG TPA: 50S ribosomal protein L7/L12 [Candidatus Xenobia bacterium]|jgi:large subunit ribosomal protein L7/L12
MATMTKDQLVEAISSLSLLEAAELSKALEEKLGVTASAPMMAMPAGGGGGGAAAAAPAEEKTTWDVELTSVNADANKVQVIKVVREFSTLGLKEAKELVDSAPKIVKEGASKDEGEKMKAKFAEVGAKITLK